MGRKTIYELDIRDFEELVDTELGLKRKRLQRVDNSYTEVGDWDWASLEASNGSIFRFGPGLVEVDEWTGEVDKLVRQLQELDVLPTDVEIYLDVWW